VRALAALPEPAEADRPPEARGLARDAVRLLAVSRARLLHARFSDLPDLLSSGDILVVNTSRTLPASLPARRPDSSAVTVNLSTPVPLEDSGRWIVEVRRAGGRVRDARAGEELAVAGRGRVRLVEPFRGSERLWVAELALPAPVLEHLERHGRPVRYRHLDGAWPLEAHQNVYADEPGSAEMPSAGRPFTAELITRLVARGIDVAPVVLHTGVSSLERGEAPYPERFRVPRATAERVNLARRLGGRAVAVGTTVVRALESAAIDDGSVRAAEGWTDLVIGPGRRLRAVDAILTGFHDRDSSHVQMLEALAGRTLIQRSFRAATAGGYLRHEFGDVQLIEP
jgi:S-adenosylmethionine:tRNA ribosyltransferase-isomerase